jgi:chlorite dismutase
MPEPTRRVLSHFGVVQFTARYWDRPAAERTSIRSDWLAAVRAASASLHLYQLYPLEARGDLLLWASQPAESASAAGEFFGALAAAAAPYRPFVTLGDALWGFSRPSQYTKTRSRQEMDPFSAERLPYLVAYPFIKTDAWYQKSRDERQAMMMGHIKIGKQFEEIRQLLLYSTGLQDQEFVVVYETPDLMRFLELVTELRSSEARPYTLRDSPLHAAVYQPDGAALARWL